MLKHAGDTWHQRCPPVRFVFRIGGRVSRRARAGKPVSVVDVVLHKPQRAANRCCRAFVGGMINAIVHDHFVEIKGAYAVEAGYVDAKFVWVRPPLVVGINPACGAEVVFRRSCVELVQCQVFGTFGKRDPVEVGADRHRPTHAAKTT